MTQEQVNHFLTLFIGECWHEWEAINSMSCNANYRCINCKKERYITKSNPDFYTPNDFDRLRKWMEKNQAELWEKYSQYCLDSYPIGQASKAIDTWLNPSNLYEFLKERREEWGYIDTHIGNMADGKIMHRDIHPAAKYLDSLEVLDESLY